MPFSASTLSASTFERRSGAYYTEQIVVADNSLTVFSSGIICNLSAKVNRFTMKIFKPLLKIFAVIAVAVIIGYFLYVGTLV